MGTLSVMSPEVLAAKMLEDYMDQETADMNDWPVADPAAADVWAVGACLLEFFPTTVRPFVYANAPDTMLAQMQWVSVVLIICSRVFFAFLECMYRR